jgi:NitT/TauT family transport system substrate-binding protein
MLASEMLGHCAEELMSRSIRTILLTAAVASLASATTAATAQPLKQLRVTIPVIGMNFLPLFVAADKGMFAKEGFEVEIISTSGDGPDVDALIARSVQFTISTPNRLLTSFEQGKPLLAIMNMANRNAIDCVINKETAAKVGITESTPIDQKLKALRGLKVAGTRPGAFTYLVLVDYAKRAGLVPQQDLQILGVGGGPGMIAALENGAVDVACNTSPTTDLMVKRGKAIMFTYNSVGRDPAYEDFLFELLYVRPDYAKANPEIVRAFCRALLAAIADIRDTPARDQLPLLQKRFTGVEDDMLIQVLEILKPMFPRDGKVTPTSLDKAIKFMLDTGAIKAGAPWAEIATYDYLPK